MFSLEKKLKLGDLTCVPCCDVTIPAFTLGPGLWGPCLDSLEMYRYIGYPAFCDWLTSKSLKADLYKFWRKHVSYIKGWGDSFIFLKEKEK